ncbi:unnamed protein product [Ambrosiozyma monospora]|uniref:Unnamed protein product n=1 Tax=Ambrosiozyma monospora TaxID=43982 RepID=A0A9W6Z8V4_AMBMO|nr:unnamed protein product [Ambrosiozyma monospora]
MATERSYEWKCIPKTVDNIVLSRLEPPYDWYPIKRLGPVKDDQHDQLKLLGVHIPKYLQHVELTIEKKMFSLHDITSIYINKSPKERAKINKKELYVNIVVSSKTTKLQINIDRDFNTDPIVICESSIVENIGVKYKKHLIVCRRRNSTVYLARKGSEFEKNKDFSDSLWFYLFMVFVWNAICVSILFTFFIPKWLQFSLPFECLSAHLLLRLRNKYKKDYKRIVY